LLFVFAAIGALCCSVSRCEHELKAYQLQYPDLVRGRLGSAQNDLVNELSGAAEELPPWVGQAKYMSPLLVAYEARIEELTEKNQEQLVSDRHSDSCSFDCSYTHDAHCLNTVPAFVSLSPCLARSVFLEVSVRCFVQAQ